MQATRWEELEPGPAAEEQREKEREREREKEKEREKQNSYIESKVNLSICNLIKQSHVSTYNY